MRLSEFFGLPTEAIFARTPFSRVPVARRKALQRDLQAAFRTMVATATPLAGVAAALDRLLLDRGSERYATVVVVKVSVRPRGLQRADD